MRQTSIFLCHASEDYQKVTAVYNRLKAEGFSPWLDKIDLLPGQIWDEEIRRIIRNSDFTIVFLSNASVSKRGYVQKEFKLALDVLQEMPEGQIYVVPVRLENCEVPERFRSIHWCDLFETGGIDKLIGGSARSSKASGSDGSSPAPVGARRV